METGVAVRGFCRLVLLPVLPGLLALIPGAALADAAGGVADGYGPGVQRRALIIANQTYLNQPKTDSDQKQNGRLKAAANGRPAAGYLPNLTTPCENAKAFRKFLIQSKWLPEEAPEALCDLDVDKMSSALRSFKSALAKTTRTVGIFYYSGHGVSFEVGGEHAQYLLGTKSKIDPEVIRKSQQDHPGNLSFLSDQALLFKNEVVVDLGFSPSSVMLYIIDACRNNPFMGDLIADTGVKAGPIALKNVMPPQALALYAAPEGKTTPDNDAFNRALIDSLGRNPRLQDAVNSMVTAGRGAGDNLAVPQVDTDGGLLGEWCIYNCAPGIAPRPHLAAGGIAGMHLPGVHYTVINHGHDGDAVPGHGGLGDAAAMILDGGAPAEEPVSAPIPRAASQVRFKLADAGAPDGIAAMPGASFDILWCDDGPGAESRRRLAESAAEMLADEARSRVQRLAEGAGDGGLRPISLVRIRPLEAFENTAAAARFTANTLRYNRKSAAAARWLGLVREAAGGSLVLDGAESGPDDYFPIAFCKLGATERPAALQVRVMVPDATWQPAGQSLLARAMADEGGEAQAPPVAIGDRVPDLTELRFFTTADRDAAFALAAGVERSLGHAIRVRYNPAASPRPDAGTIELWIGRSEPLPAR